MYVLNWLIYRYLRKWFNDISPLWNQTCNAMLVLLDNYHWRDRCIRLEDPNGWVTWLPNLRLTIWPTKTLLVRPRVLRRCSSRSKSLQLYIYITDNNTFVRNETFPYRRLVRFSYRSGELSPFFILNIFRTKISIFHAIILRNNSFCYRANNHW